MKKIKNFSGGKMNEKVIIYTDGACAGNPGPGGWGAILMYKGAKKEISGGMKETTLAEMLAKKPEKVIELAVKGMLPKGPLGRAMIKKLHVYAGAEHANAAQKPEVLTF